jgi:LAO/AO transport system kinase
MGSDLQQLLSRFSSGDALAASRAMSVIERGGAEAESLLDSLHAKTGRAWRTAFTGPGGAGKSSLVDYVIALERARGRTVGVVAEDPSSPFSGGAILGDRVRMVRAHGDAGVFVRSLASRGSETGLSALACELADVMDAFGRDVVILESMGVGQVETRVRFAADTVVVVLTPEAGDDVQTMKSGLLEVADIFVVNKSDRPGAETLAAELVSMVALRDTAAASEWRRPVVATSATGGNGLDVLSAALSAHRAHLEQAGRRDARRRESLRERVRLLVEERTREELWRDPMLRTRFDGILEAVAGGRTSPYRAARDLVEFRRENARGPALSD